MDFDKELTEFSFKIGALSRTKLEDLCADWDIDWGKHDSSDELRSRLLEGFSRNVWLPAEQSRQAYLQRNPAGSVGLVLAEAVLVEFDQYSLGLHPTFLRMLDAFASAGQDHRLMKKSKNAAYSVLGKAKAARLALGFREPLAA